MIIIKFNDSDKITIKHFLIQKLNLSSSKISKMLKNNNIKVNNQKINFNYILKKGDEIKVYNLKNKKTKSHDTSFLDSNIKLDVFYEDQNIIIINKSRGVVCQEDKNEKINTLNNAIKKYLYLKKEYDLENDFVPHLCHRLDKYTSGLIITAKNAYSLTEINNALKENKIKKIYECLVHGILKEKSKTLVNYIMMDEVNKIMKIDKNNIYNKKIITRYKVLEEFKNYSKLEVELLTGRKHQIRVHLSSINHPLLGDSKYNKINLNKFKFPCLVSKEIKFNFDKSSKLNYLNSKLFKLKNVVFE